MFNFRSLALKLVFILLLALILTPATGHAADKFIARVIYFKSQEAPPVNHEKYDKIMRDMQDFFRKEMIRLGFGDKTFKYEKNNEGKLKIHSFTAKHPAEHYTGEVFLAWYEKIRNEIPHHLNNTTNRDEQNNIYIIIYGGIPIRGDGRGSPDGGGWTFSGGAVGGSCVVNENYDLPNRYEGLIAHEFAHTFGLKHNNFNDSLMGTTPIGFAYITDFEARLINKHHLVSDVHIFNKRPEIVDKITSKAIDRTTVRFEIQVRGDAELYHAQLSKGQDYIGSAALEGRDDIAEIDVPRHLLANGDNLELLVIDVNGNKSLHTFKNIQLPEHVIDKDSTFKFLTIRHRHPDSIVPTNNEIEWVGWENAGIFEKMPNGVAQKLLDWYKQVPKLNEYDSWFYSHAIARFEYDISAWEFNRFDSFFYLPNPCGESVEVICLADDVEIYRSEVLRTPAAQNKHFQIDIPKDTKTFTIQVTDAGDGIKCDHFVFGEAKVLVTDDEPEPEPDDMVDDILCENCVPDEEKELNVTIEEDLGINSKNKLTTKWATIKARK